MGSVSLPFWTRLAGMSTIFMTCGFPSHASVDVVGGFSTIQTMLSAPAGRRGGCSGWELTEDLLREDDMLERRSSIRVDVAGGVLAKVSRNHVLPQAPIAGGVLAKVSRNHVLPQAPIAGGVLAKVSRNGSTRRGHSVRVLGLACAGIAGPGVNQAVRAVAGALAGMIGMVLLKQMLPMLEYLVRRLRMVRVVLRKLGALPLLKYVFPMLDSLFHLLRIEMWNLAPWWAHLATALPDSCANLV
jgi:hypothetical protein